MATNLGTVKKRAWLASKRLMGRSVDIKKCCVYGLLRPLGHHGPRRASLSGPRGDDTHRNLWAGPSVTQVIKFSRRIIRPQCLPKMSKNQTLEIARQHTPQQRTLPALEVSAICGFCARDSDRTSHNSFYTTSHTAKQGAVSSIAAIKTTALGWQLKIIRNSNWICHRALPI
jgi:hypothetical protein